MDLLQGLESQHAIILLGMVAGVIELIKRLFAKDWKAAITIAAAALVGTLVSLAIAIDPLLGAVIGLAASGYVTIAQHIGDN